MKTAFTFDNVDDLLKASSKIIEVLKVMFPNLEEHKLRTTLIVYMLQNSTLKNEKKHE